MLHAIGPMQAPKPARMKARVKEFEFVSPINPKVIAMRKAKTVKIDNPFAHGFTSEGLNIEKRQALQ
ncbi:MAG: hypothetical protein MK183_08685 [Verrucomicrobiales bacterium]|nr:hypothetical protein [Verrucomicrobiales bacterium]